MEASGEAEVAEGEAVGLPRVLVETASARSAVKEPPTNWDLPAMSKDVPSAGAL
ncbi:MAG: hypothetical protein KAV83_00105 [Desulfobacterales bacterium]|nr:hypothetical protein [Desulfobacterales bacterium]